jgi:hypothetical protein
VALIDDFKVRFPEFDEAVVDQWLPILEPRICCYYGGVYSGCGEEVILNLLAHLMAIESGGSVGGGSGSAPVKGQLSKSVGSVSVSYAARANANSSGDEFFSTTRYGQTFLYLISSNIGGYVV